MILKLDLDIIMMDPSIKNDVVNIVHLLSRNYATSL